MCRDRWGLAVLIVYNPPCGRLRCRGQLVDSVSSQLCPAQLGRRPPAADNSLDIALSTTRNRRLKASRPTPRLAPFYNIWLLLPSRHDLSTITTPRTDRIPILPPCPHSRPTSNPINTLLVLTSRTPSSHLALRSCNQICQRTCVLSRLPSVSSVYRLPLHAPSLHLSQMAQSLDEQASMQPVQPVQLPNASFPQPAFTGTFAASPPANDYSRGFPPQAPASSRGPTPLPPPQGSNWSPWSPPPAQQSMTPSFPMPFASPGPSGAQHEHQRSLSGSFANMSLGPRTSSPLSGPSGARDGPPSLTAPLPTLATLSVQQSAIQQPTADPSRKIVWCRDVLSLVDRAQQLYARSSPTSTDPVVGPAQIDDPELQKLVNVAIPIILQIASQQPQGPIPPHVAEAIYMRAMCASTGIYPQFIPHDPRTAFRDFERAAKSGYHAAWFKLGREYENFGDLQHAKECFERGTKHGVESCFYVRILVVSYSGKDGILTDYRTCSVLGWPI